MLQPQMMMCAPQGPIYAESGGSHDDRKVSGDLERRVDAEVLRIVREAYQRAVSILVSWHYVTVACTGGNALVGLPQQPFA